MGFFNDLKQDLTQAVNELTDGTEEETVAVKKEPKEKFGRKSKKNAPKAEPVKEMGMVPLDTEERSATEKALWDEIRADLTEAPKAAEDVITEDDVVEEIAEIEEVPAYAEVKEEAVMANETSVKPNLANIKKPASEYVLPTAEVSDEVGIVTAGMAVAGNIYSAGHMEIYGSVDGNVEINGSLRLLGTINGNVKASEVIIESGKIKGDVTVGTGISIANGSVVIGQIAAGSGAVVAGAVKGDLDIHGPVTLDSTAIIKGNIKSQSVQMANGAMVDGMCSQCYSEVDLSSFFENL